MPFGFQKKFRMRYVFCMRNVSFCSSRYCWHLCVDFSNLGTKESLNLSYILSAWIFCSRNLRSLGPFVGLLNCSTICWSYWSDPIQLLKVWKEVQPMKAKAPKAKVKAKAPKANESSPENYQLGWHRVKPHFSKPYHVLSRSPFMYMDFVAEPRLWRDARMSVSFPLTENGQTP